MRIDNFEENTFKERPADFNNIFDIASANDFIEAKTEELRYKIEEDKVIMPIAPVSKFATAIALLFKAIGDKLLCVYIDHGFWREKNQADFLSYIRDTLGVKVDYIDAREEFMSAISEETEGMRKHKIAQDIYTNIFIRELEKHNDIRILADSNTHIDILKALSNSLPFKKIVNSRRQVNYFLQYANISPLKMLFPTETRIVGEALGLPRNILDYPPISPSGLSTRCLGKITAERLEALRRADAILCEEFDKCGLAKKVWQYFIAIPDIKSVGVKDDSRYEGWPAIIRAVNTTDTITATIEEIPYPVLHTITNRIVTEVPGINRVLYDLTPKPTGTIEWE